MPERILAPIETPAGETPGDEGNEGAGQRDRDTGPLLREVVGGRHVAEEDETGEEVVFSGDEYVIENPVLINGDAQEAFEEWEYELPNLTVR